MVSEYWLKCHLYTGETLTDQAQFPMVQHYIVLELNQRKCHLGLHFNLISSGKQSFHPIVVNLLPKCFLLIKSDVVF